MQTNSVSYALTVQPYSSGSFWLQMALEVILFVWTLAHSWSLLDRLVDRACRVISRAKSIDTSWVKTMETSWINSIRPTQLNGDCSTGSSTVSAG